MAHRQTRAERIDAGRALRVARPRESQAALGPSAERPDPIELLVQSSLGRIERLVPIRYGRMLASPFAFYRGAAAIMAADLAGTPCTGIGVQACGDAHLVNFGGFATPERRIIFDINDFDETHPAPWEWDLKRLAAKGFATQGERMVFGQRLMQAASDLFLGHTIGPQRQHMDVRQLRDVKVKPMVELYNPRNMLRYAASTGWALARAHARSGDPTVLAGYIGKGDALVEAIAQFAVDYAEQNERDHAALVAAVRAGRIEAETDAG